MGCVLHQSHQDVGEECGLEAELFALLLTLTGRQGSGDGLRGRRASRSRTHMPRGPRILPLTCIVILDRIQASQSTVVGETQSSPTLHYLVLFHLL